MAGVGSLRAVTAEVAISQVVEIISTTFGAVEPPVVKALWRRDL